MATSRKSPSAPQPSGNQGVDYEAVKLEFVTTYKSLTTLAEEFGMKGPALRRHARHDKWDEARQDYREKFQANAQASKIETATMRLTQWNEETFIHAGLLREAARRQFQYQVRDGGHDVWRFKTDTSAKDISAAASAYVASDKMARLALGASTDNLNNTNKSLPATIEDFF